MSNAVQRKLRWLDARDTTVFNDLMDDLYFIQTYALDEESFNILYGLFLRKYTEEYQFFDKELKQDVCRMLFHTSAKSGFMMKLSEIGTKEQIHR